MIFSQSHVDKRYRQAKAAYHRMQESRVPENLVRRLDCDALSMLRSPEYREWDKRKTTQLGRITARCLRMLGKA